MGRVFITVDMPVDCFEYLSPHGKKIELGVSLESLSKIFKNMEDNNPKPTLLTLRHQHEKAHLEIMWQSSISKSAFSIPLLAISEEPIGRERERETQRE